MIRRHFLLSLLLACGAALGSIPAATGQTDTRAAAHHGPLSPDQELANLTRSLQLSNDQQNRLRPILIGRREQLVEIHNSRTLSREDKSAKMKALDDGANQKVLTILNPDQKAKYQGMIEQRKAALAKRQSSASRVP